MIRENTALLIILSLVLIFPYASSLSLWDNRYPAPTSAEFFSGAFGNNKFLIVGGDGTLFQSTDGVTWDPCVSPIDGDYFLITYTNGFYLVSDKHNTVAYSQTGDCNGKWAILSDLKKNSNLFTVPSPVPEGWTLGFVGSNEFKLYYSISGDIDTFELVTGIDFAQYSAWGVAYGNSQWVAKLSKPLGDDVWEIFTSVSTNGRDWSTPHPTNFTSSEEGYGFAFCPTKGVFLSAFEEGVGISADALLWELQTPGKSYHFRSLVCSPSDRCIGTTDDRIYDSLDCGEDFEKSSVEPNSIPLSFPIYGTVPGSNSSTSGKDLFLIAGPLGEIYSSSAFDSWYSAGADFDEADHFDNCDKLMFAEEDGVYLINCQRGVTISSNGRDWDYKRYEIEGDPQFDDMDCHDDLLVAYANKNVLYLSDDYGSNWNPHVKFSIRDDDDDYTLSGIQFSGTTWFAYGSDTFPEEGVDKDLWVEFPLLGISKEGIFWNILAPNASLTQVQYSFSEKWYLGVGQNGIYRAEENFSNWTLVSPVDGECYSIQGDTQYNFVALCRNRDSENPSQEIIKISSNAGLTWESFYSPCSIDSSRDGDDVCTGLRYIASWNSFVIFAKNPSGLIYSSDPEGRQWGRVDWPYAVSILDILQGDDSPLLVTLSEFLVFSGSVETVTFQNRSSASLYSQPMNPSSQPVYPMNGYLTTIPKVEGSESDSGDDFTGGQIFGIIVGVFFLLLLVTAIVVIVAVVGFLFRRNDRRQEFIRLIDNTLPPS